LAGERPVRAVVRSIRARKQLEAAIGELEGEPEGKAEVEIRALDYADAAALASAAVGCTHVVHLVGIIKENDGSTYVAAHEDTTRALVEAAESVGIRRVVYLSILGASSDSENTCLASKGRAEDMLLGAAVPALVLRVPMVLGEGDYASRALAGRARRSHSVTFRGESLEQPIYAGDVVNAIVAGLSHEGLDDLALDLAGPESLTRAALTARAGAVLGTHPTTLSLPLALGYHIGRMMEVVFANPPLTATMLGVLDHDDAIDPVPAFERLGIELTSLDDMLRACLGAA
jgi:NADH dehydrogenase